MGDFQNRYKITNQAEDGKGTGVTEVQNRLKDQILGQDDDNDNDDNDYNNDEHNNDDECL